MIKTLRITSFLAAFIALGFFIFIAARGMAANENVENLLKLPGVAEQFQADSAGRSSADSEAETPLTKQAKAFALRINPPPPPEPVRPKSLPNETPRPQVPVTAKFTLIGTSYHFGDETTSLALIDEVGKGLHWVKQGGKVGYLTIEKIGDGKVLINDNGRTYELTADREKTPDLVKSYTGPVIKDEPIVLWDLKEEAAKSESAIPVPGVDNAETSVPQLSPEELRQQTQENIEWIKKIQDDPNSLGMTAEEANELGGLGELLTSLENEIGESNEAADSNSATITDVNQQAEESQEEQEQQILEEKEQQQEQPKSETPTSRARRIKLKK
jgi:hypothetical protein